MMNENPEDIINELSTRQVKALASQCKIENWYTESISVLRRKLIDIAKYQEILEGEDA
jgi:hypothetical protein